MLNSVWQVMATIMASKLDSLAGQGYMVIVTFNTAQHSSCHLNVVNRNPWPCGLWRTLYQTLVEQGKMSVCHITSEMGERMEVIL